MILIAHRGNTNGRFENYENEPTYIDMALSRGYDVEIDVWYKDKIFFLGHDAPLYGGMREKYFENNKLWCHAKNLEAFEKMLANPKIHCFWHENDKVTLTSKGIVWTYPNIQLISNSICVMPESQGINKNNIPNCLGICSDNISDFL